MTDPEKKSPVGTSVAWVADNPAVDWPIPTWFEDRLYKKYSDGQEITSILNALSDKLRSLAATDDDDNPVLRFEWWRLPKPTSKKAKPLRLKASLFMHPEYDSLWLLMEYDSE